MQIRETQGCERVVNRTSSLSLSNVPHSHKDGNVNLNCGWFSDRTGSYYTSDVSSPPLVPKDRSIHGRTKSVDFDSSEYGVSKSDRNGQNRMIRNDSLSVYVDAKGQIQGKNSCPHITSMTVYEDNLDDNNNIDKGVFRNDQIFENRMNTRTADRDSDVNKATCSVCLHPSAHAYEVIGAVTRKITKPARERFHENKFQPQIDRQLNFNCRESNYSHDSKNSRIFSEREAIMQQKGSCAGISENLHSAGGTPGLVKDYYSHRTHSDVRYDTRITSDKEQAICAAGPRPDMAEGKKN